jgi:cobalt-precorrin-5B (C1)-methyltransferase
MLLTGHAGKLVKVAGGIMNTHSREADCRMEIIAAAALREGADRDALLGILDSMTSDGAFAVLSSRGLVEKVSARLMDSIAGNLRRRAQDSLDI